MLARLRAAFPKARLQVRLDGGFAYPEMLDFLEAQRKLRALAVTSAKRASMLPDLPTIAESGLPTYAVSTWFGLLAPARTPPSIVRQLNGAVAQVLKVPEVKEFLSFSALEPAGNLPQEFEAQLRAEMEKWRKVVGIARLHVD